MTDDDRERMIELWKGRLRASTDFEAGWHQGAFETYGAQNGIEPDEFPALRDAARVHLSLAPCETASAQ